MTQVWKMDDASCWPATHKHSNTELLTSSSVTKSLLKYNLTLVQPRSSGKVFRGMWYCKQRGRGQPDHLSPYPFSKGCGIWMTTSYKPLDSTSCHDTIMKQQETTPTNLKTIGEKPVRASNLTEKSINLCFAAMKYMLLDSSKLIGHLEGYLCILRLPVQKW